MSVPDFRRSEILICILLGMFFLLATLPYLADFPALDWPQMGIAAPAWKLASEGIYGNDLFAGFHRSELRNYEYMPVYPILVAAGFRIFGLGVLPARAISLLCAFMAIMLTYLIGRRFWGRAVGLGAAGFLVIIRLGLLPGTSGIPLLDHARVIRYDILVPVFVLAATYCFLGGLESSSERKRLVLMGLAGALAGLASLTHVYGAFILVVFLATLLWQRGLRLLVEPSLYLLAVGFSVAILPWWAYVAIDPEAYAGQMSRHVGRFEVLDPNFYWNNLLREPGRFRPWLKGGFPDTLLRPRVGIWLLILGTPAAFLILLQRSRDTLARDADRLLFLSLPLLELCLALLIFMKRNVYTLLLLPFLALWIAAAAERAWQAGSRRPLWRLALGAVALLALVEGGVAALGLHGEARRASSYLEVCHDIAAEIPSGSSALISQPYWLGLEEWGDFELRSANLIFLMVESMGVDEAFEALQPDVVVIESYFLEEDSLDPRGPPPDSRHKAIFLQMRDYLERECSVGFKRLHDATYGNIDIYHCSAETPSTISARNSIDRLKITF